MADRFDVSARLAEGRPAVEHTQTYVDACHQLGYQQPDLTAHTSQVWDWYDTEAGLDLRILDDDVGALRAAVNAIEEALWVQRTQVTELAAAWRGSGADTAMRFLQRHCDVAAEVAAHVGAAAEHYAALRDDVWRSVDGKVANAVAIDERRTAERSTWLAACHSVTAGTGDRSTAEEVIRQQVKPYVDNDIRNDWLAAMGAGSASVAASYDEAIHALASTSEVRFDVPGDFGPSWQPAFEERPVTEATPVVALPAAPAPTVPAAAPAIRLPTSPEPQGFSTDDARRCGINADRIGGSAWRCQRIVHRCRQSRRTWRYHGRHWWRRRKHRRQYRQHSRLIGRRARRWLRVGRCADR